MIEWLQLKGPEVLARAPMCVGCCGDTVSSLDSLAAEQVTCMHYALRLSALICIFVVVPANQIFEMTVP